MNSETSIIQNDDLTLSSIPVHGAMLLNCWLTGERLKTFLHQTSFYQNRGVGETYTYILHIMNPKVVHTLKTWNNAIILQNSQQHIFLHTEIKLRLSFHHDETKSGALVVTPQLLGDTHRITTQAHPKELLLCRSSASQWQNNIFSCSKDIYCGKQIDCDLVSLNLKYLSFCL